MWPRLLLHPTLVVVVVTAIRTRVIVGGGYPPGQWRAVVGVMEVVITTVVVAMNSKAKEVEVAWA